MRQYFPNFGWYTKIIVGGVRRTSLPRYLFSVTWNYSAQPHFQLINLNNSSKGMCMLNLLFYIIQGVWKSW